MNKHKIMQKLIFGLLLFVLGNIIVQASHGASTEPLSVDDPWEKFNRKMFAFNESLDHHILKPVAVRYRTYTPKPVQGLINNFFNNLGDIRNFANALLQLKLKDASVSLTRFVINSTIGQLGFVDVASPIGLEKHYEDFGLTLAHWHIPSGPYLVLPLFGSGTVRSACGLVPDHYTYPPNYSRQFSVRAGVTGADIVQKRAQLLNSEQLVMGNRYSFIRDAWLQQRYFMITGKQQPEDF